MIRIITPIVVTAALLASPVETGDADRAAQLFWELQANPESNRSYVLLEEDLNAYLARELTLQPSHGIEQLLVKMNQGSFTTLMTLNLDEVELDRSSAILSLFSSILQGTQSLKLEGTLVVKDGVGTYKTKEAWLNELPVPAILVDTLLSSVGKQQEPPFDPTEPFQAPYRISELTIAPGRAILVK